MAEGEKERGKNDSRAYLQQYQLAPKPGQQTRCAGNFYLPVFNLLGHSGNTFRGSSAVARLPLKRKILRSIPSYLYETHVPTRRALLPRKRKRKGLLAHPVRAEQKRRLTSLTDNSSRDHRSR